ncbi:C40 family peptidase [Modestobacter lapidis]|nr:C40 family peptidase [Modestobacter lapidis]
MAGVAVAATLCLGAAPGVAAASPTNPTDAEIGAARQSKDAAAQQVGVLAAQLATAQAGLDAARAESAIALDGFQATQAEYEAAQVTADAATAEARRADAALADSRAQVAQFARTSYVQGSTSPGLAAVLSAGGPAEVLERVALLDAAGRHETDVLALVTVAQQQAADADADAATALAAAEVLKQAATEELAAAERLESAARAQAVAVAAQQSAVQAQLEQAQQELLGLEGARAAVQQYAQQQAAAAADAQRVQQEAQAPAAAGVRSTSAGRGSASAAQTAVGAGMRWIGTRYAWGGGSLRGPSPGWGIDEGIVGFDCSGLTRYAYAQAGIDIPRNSRAQYAALPKVSRSALQAGDLVFWATNTGNPATIHHVAIYLGGDRMLEAPQSGSTVRVTSMRWSGYIGAVRPSA